MALLITWKNLLRKVRAPRVAFKLVWNELVALDGRIDDVEAGTVAAGSISETELANGAVTESKLGTGAVTSGKLGNGSVATAKIADDAITAGKLGFKAVVVTVALEATTGSSAADATLVDGALLGILPTGNQDQIVDDVDLNADGSITITLAAAATAENTFIVNALLP